MTEGSVTKSIVSSSTLGNLRVDTCIAEAARRWEFPAVKDGGLVIVTYPFHLTAFFEGCLPSRAKKAQGQRAIIATRLRTAMEGSAKPARDPIRKRPGTNRGKASHCMK
jgi:hypothetical protein